MRILSTLLSVAVLVAAVGVSPVIADDDSKSKNNGKGSDSPAARLIVPLTGTVVSGGTFTGSFRISRVEKPGGTIHPGGVGSGGGIGPSARAGGSGAPGLPGAGRA